MRIRLLHTEAFRLSAIYAGLFSLSVLGIGLLVAMATRQALEDQLLQSSRNSLAAITRGYTGEGLREAREVLQQLLGAPGTPDYLLMQRDGRLMAGNLPAMAPRGGVLRLAPGAGHGEILGEGQFLAPGLYVFSGSSTAPIRVSEARIRRDLSWLFAASLLLAALSGALVSRAFLRKSDMMAKACRAIMDGDMRARIPVRGSQDELDRLAATINDMLDRIAALMENLGQVTNDVAHDLRTPVSQLRQRLELSRAGMDAAAVDAAIAKTDEILALFSALLRIAQIEGGARRAGFTTLDLAPLLGQVAEMYEAVADNAGHHLHLNIAAPAAVRGDRALLVQLLSNLIENAILHTPPGTSVTLSLDQAQGRAVITVHDNGPGVPAQEREKLFRRLYRREASRSTPGYGLGLSLVAAMAELHGAKLDVGDAQPGLAVAVIFPA